MRTRIGRLLTLGLIIGLVPAATARATDRYVDANAGGGDMNPGCTVAPSSGDGCTLDNGITAAGPGDRVFMAAGTYASSPEIIDDANLELIGAGSPQTTISTTAAGFASLFIQAAGVKVSGLRIVDSSTNGNAIQVASGAGAVIEGVSAIASGFAACLVQASGTTTIRDSVCAKIGTGVGNPAIQVSGGAAQQLVLTNVTAYAGNTSGIALYGLAAANQDTTITARNSIFNAPTGQDVLVNRLTAGHTITFDADYSSFATDGTDEPTEEITPVPGSAHNIIAPAVFADTDTNYRQAAGSPTIDKGSATFLSAPLLDIDGGARTVGSAPDIGADEFVPPTPATTPPPAATTGLAAATGQRAAALKKCKKKKGTARKKCKKKALKLPV